MYKNIFNYVYNNLNIFTEFDLKINRLYIGCY